MIEPLSLALCIASIKQDRTEQEQEFDTKNEISYAFSLEWRDTQVIARKNGS